MYSLYNVFQRISYIHVVYCNTYIMFTLSMYYHYAIVLIGIVMRIYSYFKYEQL